MSAPYNYVVAPSVVVPASFANGIWTATLPAAIFGRKLIGMSVQGPNNSQLKVYNGYIDPSNLIDQTQRGNSNTADYSGGPRMVPAGGTVNVVWSPLGGTFTGTETVAATFLFSPESW